MWYLNNEMNKVILSIILQLFGELPGQRHFLRKEETVCVLHTVAAALQYQLV